MIRKYEILKKIIDSGVVAVIRAEDEAEVERISTACVKGGISAIEITLTVPGALSAIRELKKKASPNEFLIGAGTVLDSETARAAILEGAEFIVSPCFDKETAKLCNRYQIPYLPGCVTITEIKTALEYGASVIKLFPGNIFGPEAIKSIKGPLPQVSIMPTGGVNLSNIKNWIKQGAVAVGVGSEITKPAKDGNYEEVINLAREYVNLVKQAKWEE